MVTLSTEVQSSTPFICATVPSEFKVNETEFFSGVQLLELEELLLEEPPQATKDRANVNTKTNELIFIM